MSAELAFRSCGVVVAVAVLQSALEQLASRGDYIRGGVFGPLTGPSGTTTALSLVRVTALVRIVSAIALLTPADHLLINGLAALAAMLGTAVWMRLVPNGTEGADGMVQVTLTALGLGALGGTTRTLEVALLVIAGQASLAYTVAGVSKLVSTPWRRGVALPAILANECMSPPRWRAAVQRRSLVLSWLTMTWQSTFVLVLFAPDWLLWLGLGIGVVFHVVTALALGLNSFVPAYLATYPAVVFANGWLRSVLGL